VAGEKNFKKGGGTGSTRETNRAAIDLWKTTMGDHPVIAEAEALGLARAYGGVDLGP
jgi:hypothetical protein